ncbi:MAG: hypothetical protein WED07_11690 [Candidatus Freyarchaeum deiterrae]
MSELEKAKVRARRLSNLQKAVGYLIFFPILWLVIINLNFINNNWWGRLNLLPTPIPFQQLDIIGLTLLFFLIILQALLVYQLYKLKKEALKDKKPKRKQKKLKRTLVKDPKTRKE